jgi:ABC-type multidrug transport system fused ATPase/permease subunit
MKNPKIKKPLFFVKPLWNYFNKKRKLQLIALVILMLIVSIVEIIGISLVFPLISQISGANTSGENWVSFSSAITSNQHDYSLLISTAYFCAGIIAAGLMRLLLLYLQIKISYDLGVDFAIKIYNNTLNQNYSEFIKKNSSSIISGISKSGSIVNGGIYPLLTIINSSIMLVLVLMISIYVNPILSIGILSGIFIIYFTLIRFNKKVLREVGGIISSETTKSIKILQEGIGGFRDLKISSS